MIIVGVDPGVNGAVTILNTYNIKATVALPLTHNTLADIFQFLSEVRGGEVYYRANHISKLSSLHKVEHPRIQVLSPESTPDNTMEMYLENPGQIVVNSKTKGKDSTGALLAGMSASRKLGRSVGQWEGIAIALNISVSLVPPKVWQSAVNAKTRGDKNISKNAAIKCFPFLTGKSGQSTITHDVADSLLIALYGYLQYADPKYTPVAIKEHLADTHRASDISPKSSRSDKSSYSGGSHNLPNRTGTHPKGTKNGTNLPNPNARPKRPKRRSTGPRPV